MELRPGLSFLNIGSGTGYLSALCGFFTGIDGINHGVECSKANVDIARQAVKRFFASSGSFVPMTFTHANAFHLNVAANIRYDRVYVGAGCPERGITFLQGSLKVGGRLLAPCSDGEHEKWFIRVTRRAEASFDVERLMQVAFAPMRDCPDVLPDPSAAPFVIEKREDLAASQLMAARQRSSSDASAEATTAGVAKHQHRAAPPSRCTAPASRRA